VNHSRNVSHLNAPNDDTSVHLHYNKKLSYRLETGRPQCISLILSIAVVTNSYV